MNDSDLTKAILNVPDTDKNLSQEIISLKKEISKLKNENILRKISSCTSSNGDDDSPVNSTIQNGRQRAPGSLNNILVA